VEKGITAILRLAAERGLPSLLIGGNAIILLGYIRNTVDLDLLLPEQCRWQWLDLLRELGYRFLHGVPAFAQFEPPDSCSAPVDLMFVDQATWEKLIEGSKEMNLATERVRLPRPECLVALKLHAIASPTRRKKEIDWQDIRQIVRICALEPDKEAFRSLSCAIVMKQRYNESVTSVSRTNSALALDLTLPVFQQPQMEHWPLLMSCSDAMRHFAINRKYYMQHHDSPEQRLRDKNPEPFRL
jgi:hypothetical protein